MALLVEWDNLRFVLAVVRKSSLAAAAEELGCNPSTVTRRIAAFEEQIGVRLFDRLPGGYQATETALEMAEVAGRVEAQVMDLDRSVMQKDHRLSGVVCATLPALLVKPLSPAVAQFIANYPDIELDVVVSNQTLDLNRREADVAIRVSYNPPEHLIGRKVVSYGVANYASHEYLERHDLHGDPTQLSWLGWADEGDAPEWVMASPWPKVKARHRFADAELQVELARSGAGIVRIPCYLGDPIENLVRLEPTTPEPNRSIWVLTHRDLRKTARVRAFIDAMVAALEARRAFFEGTTLDPSKPIGRARPTTAEA